MIIGISGKIGSGKDTIAKIIQYLTRRTINNTPPFEQWIKIHNTETIEYFADWEVKRMADKLKDIVCLMTGCTRKQLEDQKFKDSILSDEWQIWEVYRKDNFGLAKFSTYEEAVDYVKQRTNSYSGINEDSIKKSERTYRWLLQYIGTDLFRDGIHKNIHVNMLFSEYIDKVPSTNGNIEETRKWLHENTISQWIIPDVRFPNEAKAIRDRNGILLRVNRKQFITTQQGEYTVHELPLPGFNAPKEHYSETALDDYNFPFAIENNGTIEDLVKNVEVFLKFNNLI